MSRIEAQPAPVAAAPARPRSGGGFRPDIEGLRAVAVLAVVGYHCGLAFMPGGFVDPGFSGHVTLELANVATLPIKLYPGMKIGQFCFFRLSSPSEHPYGSDKYGSRYQGQRGPTPSRSFQNFHRTSI